MITENFINIFINRYSVVEMFLIYAFLEDTLMYFKTKTMYFSSSYESVQKSNNQNFSNLESLMQVTILNINNYVQYLLMRLNTSYFEITNIGKLLVFLSEQIGHVNLIGTLLPKKVWTSVLDIIIENYVVVFFSNQKVFQQNLIPLKGKSTFFFQFVFRF
jgi:hypothetical protein